ncbi:hypothetical protein EV426DRAFT_620200 [Tirmania nivea]|nr:hypothetical protein EV426DRAFT_620200 [Tirmania nivea]
MFLFLVWAGLYAYIRTYIHNMFHTNGNRKRIYIHVCVYLSNPSTRFGYQSIAFLVGCLPKSKRKCDHELI